MSATRSGSRARGGFGVGNVKMTEPEQHEHAPHDHHAGNDQHARHDAHAGHDKHAGHSVVMFRNLFWLSLALTIPTLIWGDLLQDRLGYTATRRRASPARTGSRPCSAPRSSSTAGVSS